MLALRKQSIGRGPGRRQRGASGAGSGLRALHPQPQQVERAYQHSQPAGQAAAGLAAATAGATHLTHAVQHLGAGEDVVDEGGVAVGEDDSGQAAGGRPLQAKRAKRVPGGYSRRQRARRTSTRSAPAATPLPAPFCRMVGS